MLKSILVYFMIEMISTLITSANVITEPAIAKRMAEFLPMDRRSTMSQLALVVPSCAWEKNIGAGQFWKTLLANLRPHKLRGAPFSKFAIYHVGK